MVVVELVVFVVAVVDMVVVEELDFVNNFGFDLVVDYQLFVSSNPLLL